MSKDVQIRIFDGFSRSFDAWMNDEIIRKSSREEVLNAWVSYSALMTASILRNNVDGTIPYDLVATCSIRFLDSLRIALGKEDAWKRHDTLGRGNGNGVSS